jgi:hypothetical protein
VDDPETRFTHLYDTHYRRVLAYALTHAESGAAEDIASETFLVAAPGLLDHTGMQAIDRRHLPMSASRSGGSFAW